MESKTMISDFSLVPILATCNFDKTPTLPIIIFELFIALGFAVSMFFLPKVKDKMWQRFGIMAVGVLIFEMFTAPMWKNHRMGEWAYLYHDVSWILTIGWTSLILTTVLVIDKLLPHVKESQRFLIYLGILTFLIVPLEIWAVNINLRGYSPEVNKVVSGIFIFRVPIEIFYYTPVFTGLIISFYKYWSFVIDDVPLVPLKRRKWLRDITIAFIGIFLFEVMVEPMAVNQKFPQWSYIFHDISLFIPGIWIVVIGITAVLVGKFFSHFPMLYRFLIALSITTSLAIPIEATFIRNGFRVYSESAQHFYTGVFMPVLKIPIEIAFAVPFYMALMIAFIRYWENILDNNL
ncbi:hypothetical protein CAL7716_063920 [Calothrix sp. PCC 7716]|nr:hypothetical protein CAL7716_063920 [Calothrix sp. PCC 7716]